MIRSWSTAFILASLAAFLPNAQGQALATATRTGTIQAGVAGMFLNNDYTARKNEGLVVYGDYDFARLFHLYVGAEAEARFGGLISPDDIGENSYLVGPRLSYRRRNLRVYGKILVGRGTIFHDSPTNNTSSSFNLYAGGAGVEYRINRFNIRLIDVEQQKWPNFEPNTLSPLAISVGVAYIIR